MIRFFDFIFSFLGLLLLAPVFIVIGISVKLNSRGPVIYKQSRVGLNGKMFEIFKFRSMRLNSENLGLLTIGGDDPRVTFVGYYLRKFKIDELPQLINVLIGDMSLVGPRPEVKMFVELYSTEQKKVLSIRPGITDLASIFFHNENVILKESTNPVKYYIEKIMPIKLSYNLIYVRNYGLNLYFKIILSTITIILFKQNYSIEESKKLIELRFKNFLY